MTDMYFLHGMEECPNCEHKPFEHKAIRKGWDCKKCDCKLREDSSKPSKPLKIYTADKIDDELYQALPDIAKRNEVDIYEARCDKWSKEYHNFHEIDRRKFILLSDHEDKMKKQYNELTTDWKLDNNMLQDKISSLKKEIEELRKEKEIESLSHDLLLKAYNETSDKLKAEQKKNEKLNKLCPKCNQKLYCIASVGCFCWILETGKITREKYNNLIQNARGKAK